MAHRPIWSGMIGFGLVNIPVRLHSGISESRFELDMLHKKDLSPIRYAKICKSEEKEVPYDEVVKGYEIEKGEYVVLSNEDFQRAYPQKSQTIEIHNFAFIDEIDTIYFDKSYILEPGKGAAKAYSLLREALKQSKKVGIATIVLHNRERLVMIKADKRALILQQLHFPSDIKNVSDLELPIAGKGLEKEVQIALKLIEQLTEPFDPSKYKDHYREEMKKIIDDKAKGKKTVHVEEKEMKSTAVQDIMSKLKASLIKKPRRQARRRVKSNIKN